MQFRTHFFHSLLALTIAACPVFFDIPSFCADELDKATRDRLDRQIEIARQLKELAQAAAESQRQRTVQAAIEASKTEKQAANSEREKMESVKAQLLHAKVSRQNNLTEFT